MRPHLKLHVEVHVGGYTIRLHIEEVYSLSYNVEEHIELLNGNNHRGGTNRWGRIEGDYSQGLLKGWGLFHREGSNQWNQVHGLR